VFLIENPLNQAAPGYPILECIHIIFFTFSVGTIALVDFRLLDFGMKHQTPAELLKTTSAWTLIGLVVMIFSGLLLFSSDPGMYYLNAAFLTKMVCLLAAIVFNYTIHRRAARSKETSASSKVVACVSLALWGSVVFCGIFIAFVNPSLGSGG
jgi:uncharacterized membrane-anchored protein